MSIKPYNDTFTNGYVTSATTPATLSIFVDSLFVLPPAVAVAKEKWKAEGLKREQESAKWRAR